jgi:cytochrome c oxidase subunit 2
MSVDEFILRSASSVAPQIDFAMLGLVLICGFVLALVFLLIVVFGIRYRKNSPHSRKLHKEGSLSLEWGWTFGTLIVFLGLFAWGAVIYFKMHIAPSGVIEIAVVGKQWMWKFQHQNGRRELNELHVPIGHPISLKMISQDVVHSVFIPDFRLKQDVLPGRYTRTWFEASKVGEFHLFCTQYCGTMHAQMTGRIFVLSESDYEQWLEGDGALDKEQQPKTMVSRGEKLFNTLGCISCHSETTNIGPPLQGVYGSKVRLTTGQLVVADDDYIRESILYPNAKMVEGYLPIMPTYKAKVSEEELLELVAYIKSLGDPSSSGKSK